VQPINKEELYGLWISFLMELDGRRVPTDERYYKYHFARDGRFYYSVHEGKETKTDSRKQKWSVGYNEEGEPVITVNKELCYKIVKLEDDLLVLQVVKNNLVYYLARAEHFARVVQKFADLERSAGVSS
jgi:hypothetical protein